MKKKSYLLTTLPLALLAPILSLSTAHATDADPAMHFTMSDELASIETDTISDADYETLLDYLLFGDEIEDYDVNIPVALGPNCVCKSDTGRSMRTRELSKERYCDPTRLRGNWTCQFDAKAC